jgi:putative DNA methylase
MVWRENNERQACHVGSQLCQRRGGANDAKLLCVVTTRDDQSGRTYRLPTDADFRAIEHATKRLQEVESKAVGKFSIIPDEKIPQERVWKNNPVRVHLYGITRWRDIFTDRQALALSTYARLLHECGDRIANRGDIELSNAVQTCLALAVDRCADKCASLVAWHLTGEKVEHVFGRQAFPMVWDFADGNPLSEIGWRGASEWIVKVLEATASSGLHAGIVEQVSATAHPLPNESAHAFVTDPPYYDALPYSTLSNFFYVWLKRTVPTSLLYLFSGTLTPDADECVVDEARGKTHSFYEAKMTEAMAEGRRILLPSGIGLIVFAHKSTSGWEAMLQAIIDAGWIVTGSWPIDTEMGTRLRARDGAAPPCEASAPPRQSAPARSARPTFRKAPRSRSQPSVDP